MMNTGSLIKNKRKIIIVASLAIIATLIFATKLLLPYSFSSTSVYCLLSEQYLNLSLKLSLSVMNWLGYFSLFPDHVSDVGQTFWIFFAPGIRYKKMVLAIILSIWITKASPKRKSLFTIIVLVIHFLAVSLYNITGLSSNPLSDPELVFSVPDTIAAFSLFTCFVVWFRLNRLSIYDQLMGLKIDITGLRTKITALIVITYIYIIINQFVFAYFTFTGWVNFLFIPAQKLLSVMGYNATVDSTYLIGDNGTIYMAKFCLGIKTMYLFASVVYLTGRRNFRRWLYIIGGLLVINFINILRFVLLFIHIQRNGDYALSIDLHLLYNIILYSIIFLLWVFWFEKYSDLIPEK